MFRVGDVAGCGPAGFVLPPPVWWRPRLGGGVVITAQPMAAPGERSWLVAGGVSCDVRTTAGMLDPRNSTLARSIPATANALNRPVVVLGSGFDACWGLDLRWYLEKWSVAGEYAVVDVGAARSPTQTALALALR